MIAGSRQIHRPFKFYIEFNDTVIICNNYEIRAANNAKVISVGKYVAEDDKEGEEFVQRPACNVLNGCECHNMVGECCMLRLSGGWKWNHSND